MGGSRTERGNEPRLKPHMTIAVQRMLVRGCSTSEIAGYLAEQGLSEQQARQHAKALADRHKQGLRALERGERQYQREQPRRQGWMTMAWGVVAVVLGLSGQWVLKGTDSPLALVGIGVVFVIIGVLKLAAAPAVPPTAAVDEDWEEDDEEEDDDEEDDDEDDDEEDDEEDDEDDDEDDDGVAQARRRRRLARRRRSQ